MPTPPELRDSLLALRDCRAAYTDSELFYDGLQREVFASTRRRQDLAKTGEMYRLNLARTSVDAILEATKINGIITSSEPARVFLERVWEANELNFESKDLHRMVGEYGDAYLIALPDEDNESGISAYSHGPKTVRVFYDPERPREKSHAIHYYTVWGKGEDGLVRDERYFVAVAYYPDVIQKWVSTNALTDDMYVDFETVDMRLLDEKPNPVPDTIPVWHFRNERPYGRSDLEDAKAPQLMMNKLWAVLMNAADRAGYPQRYAVADKPMPNHDNFDEGSDGENSINEADFVSGPDTTHIYEGAKEVGQFSVSDSQNFLAPIDALAGYMARVTDVPVSYYRDSSAPMSGQAYRESRKPLDAKIDDRQELLGSVWSSFFDYYLTLANIDATAEIAWSKQLETDPEWWDVAEAQVEFGVPKKVILVESGRAQEDVDEWFANAEGEAVPETSVPVVDSDIEDFSEEE